MNAAASPSVELIRNRNKTLAKSLFRQLRAEGFTPEQIIELSGTLIGLVTDELSARES